MFAGLTTRCARLDGQFLLLALILLSAGCSRSFHRQQADQEAYALVEQKSNDPRWALPGFNIEIDPRSRIYDAYDPNFPPMPPDDQASHQLMHRIDGKKGFSHWDDHGHIDQLENPCWRDYLTEYTEQTEEGAIKLGLDEALMLGLLHSRDYQEQLETLYLSALDVSTERFRFDVQFFGGNGTAYQHLGSERLGGESNTLSTVTDGTFNRRFSAAGELLVGFANTWVWEFAGPNTGITTSILNFSLVQPLLRAGGRAVALEQLTIAERTLLANLRAFQRYRQGFYTNAAIGELGVSEVQRRGGFFGGTGLTGFTGTGSGGFGGVGGVSNFGRGGFGTGGAAASAGGAGLAGGGAGQVGGFIGLLQQLQQIRNTRENLNAQLGTLSLLESNLDAGLIDIAQVDQFRQNIETERANLLQAQNGLQTSLDRFKRNRLGLPPDLPIVLDDTIVRPFQFIDPRISAAQSAFAEYIGQFGDLPAEPTLQQIQQALQRVTELRQQAAEQFEAVPEDLRKLDSVSESRQQQMSAIERRLFQSDKEKLAVSLTDVRRTFDQTSGTLEQLKADLTPDTRKPVADRMVALLVELSNMLGELSLIQARARMEMITLDPVELASTDALEIARAYRLDWMNNRAALVDTWRLIEFNANRLKSDLTIRFSGDIQTLGGDNPVKFRDETGTLRASVEIDPPFTRLVERNTFRQQLIDYQRDLRQLIEFEDRIHETLRQILRTLRQLQVNLEIQRRAVAIAIRRVDQTRETLNRPAPPSLPGQPPGAFGPTAAQNLLLALSDLRNTQNNLMSVWMNYQASRMRLYRELGIMRIDENGLWIDEPLEEALRASSEECPLPPAVPYEWLQDEENRPIDQGNGVPPLPESASKAPQLLPQPDRRTGQYLNVRPVHWLRSVLTSRRKASQNKARQEAVSRTKRKRRPAKPAPGESIPAVGTNAKSKHPLTAELATVTILGEETHQAEEVRRNQ